MVTVRVVVIAVVALVVALVVVVVVTLVVLLVLVLVEVSRVALLRGKFANPPYPPAHPPIQSEEEVNAERGLIIGY